MKKFICLTLIAFLSGMISNVVSANLDTGKSSLVKESKASKIEKQDALSFNYLLKSNDAANPAYTGFTKRCYSKVSYLPYQAPAQTKKLYLTNCSIKQCSGDAVVAATEGDLKSI